MCSLNMLKAFVGTYTFAQKKNDCFAYKSNGVEEIGDMLCESRKHIDGEYTIHYIDKMKITSPYNLKDEKRKVSFKAHNNSK